MSGFFDDLWGDAVGAHVAVARLGEAALQRINRRAERIAERDGRMVRGVNRTDVAREIAEALRIGDQPRARELITAAASLFGQAAIVIEVGLQARQLELDALRAAEDKPPVEEYDAAHPHDIEDGWYNEEPR